jgi:hypothetical protein
MQFAKAMLREASKVLMPTGGPVVLRVSGRAARLSLRATAGLGLSPRRRTGCAAVPHAPATCGSR